MKSQKAGIAQVIVLVAVFLGVVVVSGATYFLVKPESDVVPVTTVADSSNEVEIEKLRQEISALKKSQTSGAPLKSPEVKSNTKTSAPATTVATVVLPSSGSKSESNEAECDALRAEYSSLINKLDSLRTPILNSYTELMTVPSGLKAIDYVIFNYHKLEIGKDSFFKELDRFDETVDELSLKTFGSVQLGSIKAAYHRWASGLRSDINADFLFGKEVASDSLNFNQLHAAYLNTTANYKTQTNQSLIDLAVARQDLLLAYKEAHKKNDCTWKIPGTTNAPEVKFTKSEFLRHGLRGELIRKLNWSASFADFCIGSSDTDSADKNWDGPKNATGGWSQEVSYIAYTPNVQSPAVFSISCSNYYGTTKKSITLYSYE